jgi:hypothetical protein
VWSRLNSGTLRVNFDSRLERPFWRSCGRVNELIISSESEIGLLFTGSKIPPRQIRVPQILAPAVLGDRALTRVQPVPPLAQQIASQPSQKIRVQIVSNGG